MADAEGGQGTEVEGDDASEKTRRSYGDRAALSLRGTKRALKEGEFTPSERVEILLKEANVLALLEVADALRSSNR